MTDDKILDEFDIKNITETLLSIEDLTKSIKDNAFHRGLNRISAESELILIKIKELNKILKDL